MRVPLRGRLLFRRSWHVRRPLGSGLARSAAIGLEPAVSLARELCRTPAIKHVAEHDPGKVEICRTILVDHERLSRDLAVAAGLVFATGSADPVPGIPWAVERNPNQLAEAARAEL